MRGNIEPRGKGIWRLRYDGPPRPDGRRRQVSETVHGGKKQAQATLRERLRAADKGVYATPGKETVAGLLTRWMETHAAINTSLRSQQGYNGIIRRDILPSIGGVALRSLRPDHILKMLSTMQARGVSVRTMLHSYRVLHTGLSHGVRWGALASNVCDRVTPPRPRGRELAIWDEEVASHFLEAAKGDCFEEFFRLALLTSMRRSELAGLRWQAVDLSVGRLKVVETVQRIVGKGLMVGEPKTRQSRRTIVLSAGAVDLLHNIRGRQLAECLALGIPWRTDGYVFARVGGGPVDPDEATRHFCEIVRRGHFPYLTLHGLRHTSASWLLADGVPLKAVSERLGHSSANVTLSVYAHSLPTVQDEAALALDRRLARGRRPATE
ncbi:MAG: tyrosine-type recombinase/integrase [Chloroflexota bacterium]|nr:tyrosine-type recombinase/integrase [Chloroflexota bacterium]